AWGHYFLQVSVYHESIGYATSVLQPMMVVYSTATIIGFFWLACKWTEHQDTTGRPGWYRVWHRLSEVSFGVYLVHALVLSGVLLWVIPVMPGVWPVALRVLLAWAVTAGSSIGISMVLANTPVLSRLVGRARPLPSWLVRRFKTTV